VRPTTSTPTPTPSSRRGRVQLAVRYIDMMGDKTVAHGLKAGENISAEVIGNTERETNLLRHMAAQTPQRDMTTKGFATFNRSDGRRFSDAWETVLNVLAKDKKTTLAATALLDGARDGLDKNAARTVKNGMAISLLRGGFWPSPQVTESPRHVSAELGPPTGKSSVDLGI